MPGCRDATVHKKEIGDTGSSVVATDAAYLSYWNARTGTSRSHCFSEMDSFGSIKTLLS
jgi:hypothetical protein